MLRAISETRALLSSIKIKPETQEVSEQNNVADDPAKIKKWFQKLLGE